MCVCVWGGGGGNMCLCVYVCVCMFAWCGKGEKRNIKGKGLQDIKRFHNHHHYKVCVRVPVCL